MESDKTARRRVVLLAAGVLVVAAVAALLLRAYLLSPDRVVERVVGACVGRVTWERLLEDTDPGDLKKNGWTASSLDGFAKTILANVPQGTTFETVEEMPTQPSEGDPFQTPSWNRKNTRVYTVTARRSDGSDYQFTIELRRHLDKRWKCSTAEIINGLNWTAYPNNPRARAEALLLAMQEQNMNALCMIRPDLALRRDTIEGFLAGEVENLYFESASERDAH